MASLNMAGPFELSQEVINEVIPEGYPGNYAYGYTDTEGYFRVQYVGRADTDLKIRITHGIGQYKQFKASLANSDLDAYHKECINWHEFGGVEKILDNKIHPATPKNKLAFCPICSKQIIDRINKR